MAARHDWTREEVVELLDRPFHDLLAEAHAVHREWFEAGTVEGAVLLSIKTGGCPEDCAYCPQSAKWGTDLSPQRLMATAEVVAEARKAKTAGATRFCMGAAWRSPNVAACDGVSMPRVAHVSRPSSPTARTASATAST